MEQNRLQNSRSTLSLNRDAWVYGAADPNSGTAALLEVAKGLGTLYSKHNWKPLRSIYLLSWSGEEYGLLGSTGWAELNMMGIGNNNENSTLLKRSLAYLNTDTAVSGDHLKVSASPSLIPLWESVIEDLKNAEEESGDGSNSNNQNELRQPKNATTSKYARFLSNVTIRDANTDWEVQSFSIANNDDENNIGTLGSGRYVRSGQSRGRGKW